MLLQGSIKDNSTGGHLKSGVSTPVTFIVTDLHCYLCAPTSVCISDKGMNYWNLIMWGKKVYAYSFSLSCVLLNLKGMGSQSPSDAPIHISTEKQEESFFVYLSSSPYSFITPFWRWYWKLVALKVRLCNLIKTEIWKLIMKGLWKSDSMLMNKKMILSAVD